MTKYLIGLTITKTGEIVIEADSPEQALEKANEMTRGQLESEAGKYGWCIDYDLDEEVVEDEE